MQYTFDSKNYKTVVCAISRTHAEIGRALLCIWATKTSHFDYTSAPTSAATASLAIADRYTTSNSQ